MLRLFYELTHIPSEFLLWSAFAVIVSAKTTLVKIYGQP